MTVYGDLHRTFLQVMMSRKLLPLPEFEELVRHCHSKCDVPCIEVSNPQALAKFVSVLNNKLSPFHMRIKGGVSEEDGSHFYALVNMRDDALSKCATKFPGNELKFFKKLVLKIAASNCGRITSTAALNMVYDDNDMGLQIRTAQSLVDQMVELGCLIVEEGNISLAPLTLLEMEPYLREQLGEELPNCHVCKQMCIKGELCPNPNCPVKLHSHCATQIFRKRSHTSGSCPSCDEPWEL
ncbi:non-structural maintenance of chromosomes element 1 homolog [Dermacentor andersoni]|uniref:non-structural maintenance of chromosomes element 1 homolog n=1 Tax=Dermacentor andersoni TaxID=34620 RepID=UPI002155E37A|nr:non-structural maintenance of chromosomes element 1 homolog [Dermacentor andersoni]